MRSLALLLAALVLFALPARAADPPKLPAVAELFTSQGCASCPPADAYLAELAAREDVIALAFHVDYWNYIGWTDPFAAPWATARQRSYERSLNQRYVYTPELVIGGRAQVVGSNRDAVEKLLAAPRPPAAAAIALSRTPDGALDVRVGAAIAGKPAANATVWLARFDGEQVTRVARGENGGRTLRDVNIVRRFERIGAWSGEQLDLRVPAAADDGEGGCAVLVQEAGAGPNVAAAMLRY
jgi:hypothetical protein